MICATHQPHLYPNAGWFHKLFKADVFILLILVDMNYRSYIHRCKLSRNGDAVWGNLSVSKNGDIIRDVKYQNDEPLKNQLLGIYGSAYTDSIFQVAGSPSSLMWQYNWESVCKALACLKVELNFDKVFTDAELIANAGHSIDDYRAMAGSQKMSYLTKLAGCDTYLSGANGVNYMDMADFAGQKVIYSQFKDVPYKQAQNSEFVPGCSVLDFIINRPAMAFEEYIGL